MEALGYVGLTLIAVGCGLVIAWLRSAPEPALVLVPPRQPVAPVLVAKPAPAAPVERNGELDELIIELVTPTQAPTTKRRRYERALTPTSVLMPRIDRYIEEALAATGTDFD